MKRLFYLLMISFVWAFSTQAQVRITDTPVPVQLPQQVTAPPTNVLLSTPTPTQTATPEGPSVLLEPIDVPANINVRDYPDVTGVYLGALIQGEQYEVTGRFFSWYRFRYENSPDGIGWVFGQSIRIIGEESLIPIVDPDVQPTPEELDPTFEAQQRLLTPENAQTATAESRIVVLPTNEILADGQFPPTYTPPADINQLQPTESQIITDETNANTDLIDTTVELVRTGNIPPIVPIVALGLFGILGIAISMIRR